MTWPVPLFLLFVLILRLSVACALRSQKHSLDAHILTYRRHDSQYQFLPRYCYDHRCQKQRSSCIGPSSPFKCFVAPLSSPLSPNYSFRPKTSVDTHCWVAGASSVKILRRSFSRLYFQRDILTASLAPDHFSYSALEEPHHSYPRLSPPSSNSYYVPPYGTIRRSSIVVMGIARGDSTPPDNREPDDHENGAHIIKNDDNDATAKARKNGGFYSESPPPSTRSWSSQTGLPSQEQQWRVSPSYLHRGKGMDDSALDERDAELRLIRYEAERYNNDGDNSDLEEYNFSRETMSKTPRHREENAKQQLYYTFPLPNQFEQDDNIGEYKHEISHDSPGFYDLRREENYELDERRPIILRKRRADEESNYEKYSVTTGGGGDRYPSLSSPSSREANIKYESEKSRGDLWLENDGRGLESSDHCQDINNFEDVFFEDGDHEDEHEPPPARSRAPPPTKPIGQFYDQQFWFGFDLNPTRSIQEAMFKDRGEKFNALTSLREREQRQKKEKRPRQLFDIDEYKGMRLYPVGDDDVDDDSLNNGSFGSSNIIESSRYDGYRDEDEKLKLDFLEQDYPRRQLRSYLSGDEPTLPAGMKEKTFNRNYDGEPESHDDFKLYIMNVQQGRIKKKGSADIVKDYGSPVDSKKNQAEEYDRFIGLGPPIDKQQVKQKQIFPRFNKDQGDNGAVPVAEYGTSKARSLDADDSSDVVFDLDNKYLSPQTTKAFSSGSSKGKKRTWEERALEMDRVPPKGAVAWGPDGQASGCKMDALTKAALDAREEICKATSYLKKKEKMVRDMEGKVVGLKADALAFERKLGMEEKGTSGNSRTFGRILRDLGDETLVLRLMKAERDAAINVVEDLNVKHWALLSEFEASKSFTEHPIADNERKIE